MPTDHAEATMPPEFPSTEARLLDLLQQHLSETGEAIAELRTGMERLADRFEVATNRLFVIALLLVVVVAATSGANLWVSYHGVQVGTGAASVAPR